MVKQALAKIFRLDEIKEKQESLTILHSKPVGTTGTEIYSGYNYEEYLHSLHGRARAREFDKIRRSDAQIKMLLTAVKGPILSAEWAIDPANEDDPQAVQDAELVEHILFHDTDKSWPELLREMLTLLDHGHAVFEVVDKVSQHPKFGTYNGIESLLFIAQRTIERWHVDKETFKLDSIDQYAFGDLGKLVKIPADFLLVFTLDKEGSNYEGISAIRCCYGNWLRKNNYLKLNAIGIEKFAVPTPMVTIPHGKENSNEVALLESALQSYCMHEKNYLMMPEGFKIDFNSNTYDPQKVEASIDNEDKRMAKSFILNFLELGMNGVGSQSLSLDLSGFFLGSLDHVANIISGTVNKVLIPRLIKMNRGPRESYPKLRHSGISDKGGREFAESLHFLVQQRVIQPDDVLEEFIRRKYKMPAASEKGRRESAQAVGQQNVIQEQGPTLSERVKMLEWVRGKRSKA